MANSPAEPKTIGSAPPRSCLARKGTRNVHRTRQATLAVISASRPLSSRGAAHEQPDAISPMKPSETPASWQIATASTSTTCTPTSTTRPTQSVASNTISPTPAKAQSATCRICRPGRPSPLGYCGLADGSTSSSSIPSFNPCRPNPAPVDGQELLLRHDYPEGRGAIKRDATYGYADGPALTENTTVYEWNHGLGEVITSLSRADLTITSLHETNLLPWARWTRMIRDSRYPARWGSWGRVVGCGVR